MHYMHTAELEKQIHPLQNISQGYTARGAKALPDSALNTVTPDIANRIFGHVQTASHSGLLA